MLQTLTNADHQTDVWKIKYVLTQMEVIIVWQIQKVIHNKNKYTHIGICFSVWIINTYQQIS